MDLTAEKMLALLRAGKGSKLRARMDMLRLIVHDMELKTYKDATQPMKLGSSGPVLQAAVQDILSNFDVKRTEWDDKKKKILDAVSRPGLTRLTALQKAEKQLVEDVTLVGNAFGDDLALVLANIPNIGKLWQHPDPRSRVMMFLLEFLGVDWESCGAKCSLDRPQYPVGKQHCRDSNDNGVKASSRGAVTLSVAQDRVSEVSHPSNVDFDFKQQPNDRYFRPKRPLDESSGQPASKRFCLANILNEEAVFEVSSPIVAANISNQENPVSKVSIPEKRAVLEVSSPIVAADILNPEDDVVAVSNPDATSRSVVADCSNTEDPIWTGSTKEYPLVYDGQISIPGSNDSFILYLWNGFAGLDSVEESDKTYITDRTWYYLNMDIEALPYKGLSNTIRESEHWKKQGGRDCLRLWLPCRVKGVSCRLTCIVPNSKAPPVQQFA
jgi:hypothetical protein